MPEILGYHKFSPQKAINIDKIRDSKKQVVTNIAEQFLKNCLYQFPKNFQGRSKSIFSVFQGTVFHLISYYSSINKSKIKAKLKTGILILYVEVLEYVYSDLRSRQF